MKALYSLLLLLFLAACSASESASDRIIAAEDAVSRGDVMAARDLCDRVLRADKDAHSALAVNELGKLSILYMRLAEAGDDTDNIDLATKCYRRAFEINADSARRFYTTLPHDDDRLAIQLSSLVNSIDNPVDIRDDAPVDSVEVVSES